ncbi:MAG: SusC/RagA family TonB-linked outer membrane protein [Rikenellaceae bacterium]|nr:SusC/RagA family TonB-linked outer membrane protein [Rikenellaceae bacterium]
MKKIVLLFMAVLGCFAYSIAQNTKVTGTVMGDDGMPVIGATVVVKGQSSIGTSTDVDGKFTLNVPKGSVLSISYVGYKTFETPAVPNVKVTLQTDAQTVETVVVTGMTKMDKRLFTGASDQLNAEEILIGGVADVSRSLEGRSAGVSVQNVSSTFGTAPKIRVRGASSILGTSRPLWVVDGVIIEDVTEVSADDLSSGDAVTMISSAIAGLNADDIESINILKDGSATSIYGAKAMAGVIVITTKKGRPGTSKLTYMGEFTTRMKPDYGQYNVMNSQDQMNALQELNNKGFYRLSTTLRAKEYGIYGQMYNLINTYNATNGTFGLENTEAARNAYLRKAEYRNTDWFDLLFDNSVMMNHSVSFSTGTEKSSSYMSLSVLTDPGWYERSSVTRYTFNANTSFNILDNLKLSILGNGSYRKQEAPGTLGQTSNAVYGEIDREFDINPFSFAMNSSRALDPNEHYVRNYTSFNIFEELANNYMEINATDLRFQGELTWGIVPGLDFTSLASFRYTQTSMQHHIKDNSNQARAYREMADDVVRNNNSFLYKDPDQLNSLPVSILPNGGIYEKREYRAPSYTIRNALTWNKTFNNTHIIHMYGGMELTSVDRSNDWFRGWGLQYQNGEAAFYNYLAFKKSVEAGDDYFTLSNTRRRSAAFFALLNYSYKGRYSINGTFRYEGTNRLGMSTSARWLPTWNVGGSWNVHEEKFFKHLSKVMSHLSFKLSYSLTADAGPDYISNSTAIIKSFNTNYRPSANDKETGLEISTLGNDELTYEKKHELNIGMSAGFLNNAINLEVDAYWRNNFDLLGRTYTQGLGGEVNKYANVANMESQGVEFTLSTKNFNRKNFKWTTDFTFSWSRQTITDLEANCNVLNLVAGSGYSIEGYAPYSIFSYPFTGLDADGFPTFKMGDTVINKESNYSGINFQAGGATLKQLKYEGPSDPIYTGGFGNTFTWKGFRLNVFMTYGFGNVVRLTPTFKNSYSDFYAMSNEFKNRWTIPGDEKRTNIPVFVSQRQLNEYGSGNVRQGYTAYNYSSARIAKGDFIRMKEISLTYNFPKEWISKLRMDNLSLKVQVTNPFLIYADKALNGQDPEYAQAGGVSSPLARQFTFTLKFGF